MPMESKVVDLFYGMVSYSKSIYDNMQELCNLEKLGRKETSAYFNHLSCLKKLLKEESKLYKENQDLVVNKRGEFAYLTINNCSDYNCNIFDLLSTFHEDIIYERIKTKVKYYVGIKDTFDDDLFKNLKIDEYVEKRISDTFLDDSFYTDIQKVSMYYMDEDEEDHERSIEYKYISSLLYNYESELADNYFELSKNSIYLSSSLYYGLSGIYEEIYQINSDDVMNKRFKELVDYIILEDSSLDDDNEYKIKIALNQLRSILDLLPVHAKEELYNNFIMNISDNFEIPNELKLRIINAIREPDSSRKLLKYVKIFGRD